MIFKLIIAIVGFSVSFNLFAQEEPWNDESCSFEKFPRQAHLKSDISV